MRRIAGDVDQIVFTVVPFGKMTRRKDDLDEMGLIAVMGDESSSFFLASSSEDARNMCRERKERM